MRICIEKATNKILEMQSLATAGTLIQNAVNAGYNASDIEEKEVNDTQYEQAKAVCPNYIKEKADKEKAEKDKKDAVDDKLIDAIKDVEGVKDYLKKLVKVIGGGD
jgi:predicted RNA-binding protein Jag